VEPLSSLRSGFLQEKIIVPGKKYRLAIWVWREFVPGDVLENHC
jgi:hypothetical protein